MRFSNRARLLLVSFRKNITAIIWGAAFSAFVSVAVWIFAYFGYTDLGLPQRYEFEKLNKIIRAELPEEYEYTIKKLPFRNAEFESLVIIARDKEAYDIDNRKVTSDIVLVLDKTTTQYKVAYKFSPVVSDPTINAPLHAVFTTFKDINNDEREEIILGWVYIGANYSPPYITIFTSSSDGVDLLKIPRLKNYIYPKDYNQLELVNTYDSKQKTHLEGVYTYFVSKDGLAIVNRSDDACSACGDEHIYNVNYLNLWKNQLTETSMPSAGIKGWEALTTHLEKLNFEIKR